MCLLFITARARRSNAAKRLNNGAQGKAGLWESGPAISRKRPAAALGTAPRTPKNNTTTPYHRPARRVAAGRATRAGRLRDPGRQTTLARLALPLPWARLCKAFSLKRSLVAQYLLEFPNEFCYATRTARGTTVSPRRTECAPNASALRKPGTSRCTGPANSGGSEMENNASPARERLAFAH